MSRRFVLRSRAEQDLTEAALWYEAQLPGLGREFLEEADIVFGQIVRFPESQATRHRYFRRALIRRFPYAVYYAIEPELIVVLAVVHMAQDPAAIMRRLE